MAERITTYEALKRTKILYRSAFICYVIPFLCLGIYSLDLFNAQKLFWHVFLLSMFPFGLLGLLFSIIGIVQFTKIQKYKKRTIGYYYLFMGILVVASGMMGWMVLYLATS